jgi:hypothetical protein
VGNGVLTLPRYSSAGFSFHTHTPTEDSAHVFPLKFPQ